MDYIRINKLKVTQNDSIPKTPIEVRLGSSKKYRLYKGNTIVWDVLQTTFAASDFSIDAEGGDVKSKSKVESYGINALGTKE